MGRGSARLLSVSAFDDDITAFAKSAVPSLVGAWSDIGITSRCAGSTRTAFSSNIATWPVPAGTRQQVPRNVDVASFSMSRGDNGGQSYIELVAVGSHLMFRQPLRLAGAGIVLVVMRLAEEAEIVELIVTRVVIQMRDLPPFHRGIAVQRKADSAPSPALGEQFCLCRIRD